MGSINNEDTNSINEVVVPMNEETPERIMARREELLTSYANFKNVAVEKRDKILDAKNLQIFNDDSNEMEDWIQNAISSLRGDSQNEMQITNVQAKQRRHETFMAELQVHHKRLELICSRGNSMISDNHFASTRIKHHIEKLVDLWAELEVCSKQRGLTLEKAASIANFIRRCDSLNSWIDEKEKALQKNFASRNIEGNDLLAARFFDSLLKDIHTKSQKLYELEADAASLLKQGLQDEVNIISRRDAVKDAWTRLTDEINRWKDAQFGDEKISRLAFEIAEIKLFLEENQDLRNVEPLNSSAAIEEQVRKISSVSNKLEFFEHRLGEITKDTSGSDAQKEIRLAKEELTRFKEEISTSNALLLNELGVNKFNSDYADIISWSREVFATMNISELPIDMDNAEQTLQIMHDLKAEIDARDEMIQICMEQGQRYCEYQDLSDKVNGLITLQKDLKNDWDKRKKFFQACHHLRTWEREATKLQNSLNRTNDLLSRLLPIGNNAVDNTQSQFSDLKRKLVIDENMFTDMANEAELILQELPDMSDAVRKQLNVLNGDFKNVQELFDSVEKEIATAVGIKNFERELEAVNRWITDSCGLREKSLKISKKNIRSEERKHQDFKNELKVYGERLKEIHATAQTLSDDGYVNALSLHGKALEKWNSLNVESEDRSEFLEAVNLAVLVDCEIKEFTEWLTRMEGQIRTLQVSATEDSEASIIKAKLKALELVNNSVQQHQEVVDEIGSKAKNLENKETFSNYSASLERYHRLKNILGDVLSSVKQQHQDLVFLSEIYEEINWVHEKLRIAVLPDADDLHLIRLSLKRNQMLLAEIDDHAEIIGRILGRFESTDGEKLKDKHLPKVLFASQTLAELFNELVLNFNLKQDYLVIAAEMGKYIEDVEEGQTWIAEKDQSFLRSTELKDEVSAERSSRQHEAFLLDLQAYEKIINDLRSTMEKLQTQKEFATLLCNKSFVKRSETEISIKKGDKARLLNDANAERWKIQSHGLIGYAPSSIFSKSHSTGRKVLREMQDRLQKAYENLMNKAEQKRRYIKDVAAAYHLNNDLKALMKWVEEKISLMSGQRVSNSELPSFGKDLHEYKSTYEIKIQQILAEAEGLNKDSSIQAIFRQNLDDLKIKWKQLGDVFAMKEQSVAARKALNEWLLSAAELEGHISEKENVISGEIITSDDTVIKKVKRDYQMVEEDMEDMGRLMDSFVDLAESTRHRYPEVSKTIYDKQKKICDMWNTLVGKLEDRRNEIRELVPLHIFLSINQDIMQWVAAELTVLNSADIANDVEGIKAMLDQQSELWDDVSAREKDLIENERFGNELIASRHLAKDEIAIQLETVRAAFKSLQTAWNKRSDLLEDALETQKFFRECEQLEAWLASRETLIVMHDVSGEDVETLLTRHEDLQKSVDKKKDMFAKIKSTGQKLLSKEIVGQNAVDQRLTDIIKRWEQLILDLADSLSRIGDERTIQTFGKQAEEVEVWMQEKILALEEIDYLPEKDLDLATQKHKSLGEEIDLMDGRLAKVLLSGQEAMNKSCKSMDQTDMIMERMQKVQVEWERLTRMHFTILTKIEKDKNRQKFKRLATDLEHWLDDAEKIVSNKDCGNDLQTVEQLVKQNDFFEVEISVYGDKLLEMVGLLEDIPKELMDESLEFDQIEAETIRGRAATIVERFDKVRSLAESRINLLNNTEKACKIAKKIDDEMTWTAEKRILAMSEDYGKNFKHFQNIYRKHSRLEEEVENRQRQVHKLRQECECIEKDIAEATRINLKLQELNKLSEELKKELKNRHVKLDSCRKYHDLCIQIDEENYWIAECTEVLHQGFEAHSSAAIECALKKHLTLEDELSFHKNRIDEIAKKATCLEDCPLNEELNRELIQLEKRFAELSTISSTRHSVLEDAANSVNFHWQCDFIEAWIVDQLRLLRFVENADNLENIRRQKSQHSMLASKIRAFENDELKKGYDYMQQLKQRHTENSLLKHWEDILKKWEMLEHKLIDVGMQLDQAENLRSRLEFLWLEFAQCASAFNSFYENSAEDLTDPILFCNSSKDLEELLKTHSTFVSSLSVAEQKYKELVDLDAEARKLAPGPNPFTWFDLQAIEETWKSLQILVQQRKLVLDKVIEKLMENERIEKEFEARVNYLTDWVNERRKLALKVDGTLDEQLHKLNNIITELADKRTFLKQIEDLGVTLEKRLLLRNQYATHSRTTLYRNWENLEQLINRLRQSVEQQLSALQDGNISAELLKEFMGIFRHYDKNLTGYVSYTDCLKCLSALGIDVGEVYEGSINKEQMNLLTQQLDPQNERKVSIQNFMSWMIAQETPDVSHGDDILGAFRALTKDGSRSHVTREELRKVLSPKELDFCLKNMKPYQPKAGEMYVEAYDYHHFAKEIAHN